jgi:uncharacterized integral membrane protein
MRACIACLLSILFFMSNNLCAQTVDTVKVSEDSTAFHMTKSPLKAVLLSAVVPGAGQVYLDQAWKVPIIWGIAGGFIYGALIQNFRYHYISDSVNNQKARGDSTLANIYSNVREFYRDDRDKWWIYLALTYIANLLDAYIAANLYDFDVSDPSPSPIESYYDPPTHTWGIGLQIKF